MHVKLLSILLIGSLLGAQGAFANDDEDAVETKQSVKGSIELHPKTKANGDLYLIVVPEGKNLFQVETNTDKNSRKEIKISKEDQDESANIQYIKIGSSSSKKNPFEVNLKKGQYQLSCLVKFSSAKCSNVPISPDKTVLSCIPLKEDTMCPEVNLKIDSKSVSDVLIKAGVPSL